ncbi:hypothetical protein HA402_011322 [Bradysia odoriphaga]|nr:hypothetical protein HA402_011322 [Bradysia odoriphaga]
MNWLNQCSNYRFALKFVFLCLLQLSSSEKVDVQTYCTNVRETFMCTGLDFRSLDIELELVANEKYFFHSIYFGESNLTTIPKNLFEAFPLAYNIEFENCGITSVYKWNFMNGESADTLNLQSNQIQQLSSEVFAIMDSLSALNLQNNLINEFDSDCFKGLPRLTKLFLSKNNITQIPPGLFSALVKLEEIYLDDNHIEVIDDDIFRYNTELRTINFGKNKIFSFSKSIVRLLGNPYELNLSHNPIEELNLINSDRLILSYTKLTTLRITNNVYGVAATHTPINEVVFTNSMDVQKMDLSYNRISDITNITKNCVFIWYLDLSHNPIDHINVKAFSKLTSLRELYLSGTNLLGLDFGSFPYSSEHGEMQLNTLDISYNNLMYFDIEILSHQNNLHSLYLDGNQLSELSYDNLKEYFNDLSAIGLSHNNWNCSFLKSMVTHLHRASIELRIDESIHNSTTNTIGGGWNCYPGARVDSDFPFYQFSQDDIYKDFEWTERFPGQAELTRYFKHIDRKLNLSKDVKFDARVTSAEFNGQTNQWLVKINDNDKPVANAKFLLLCTGALYRNYTPPFKGVDKFKGMTLHTRLWPRDGVDVAGKRVAVIGTGSSGVQVI